MFATAAIWSRCISGRIIGRMRDMNKKKLRILALIISVIMLLAGQQILDALEWGSSKLPGEFGGFMQVSGLTYEIDMSIPSPCTKDEEGMFSGINGERRVRNVMVGGEVGADYADPYGQGRIRIIQ